MAHMLGMGRSVGVGMLAAGGLVLLGLLSPVTAEAQALEDELLAVLDRHPQIMAARKAVASADENIDKAFAGFLPTVNLTGDYGLENVNTPSRRLNQGEPYERARSTIGLSVNQTLFDGGLVGSGYRSAQLSRDLAAVGLEQTRQAVMFEGIQAYLDVLRQARLVEYAMSNEQNIREQLDLEDERVRRGAGISVDVLQAKSRLQIAIERRIAFEGLLRGAVARYIQVFDRSPEIGSMAAPAPPLDLIPPTLEEAVEMAVEESPDVAGSVTQINLARERRSAARSEYMPTVSLVAARNYESGKNAEPGIRRDWSVLVRANWTLFSGFSTRAGVAAAAFDYAAAKDTSEHARRKTMEQTRIAWENLKTARQRVELLENAVNIAGEVLDARQRLREAGQETALNVLDAEAETYNAQINLAGATFDMQLASYQLLLAMGRLDMSAVMTSR